MLITIVLATVVSMAGVRTSPVEAAPPLVVLTGTGAERDGLPVAAPHPSPGPYLTELTRGFSGRLLRLYPLVQRYAHPQRPPQPAYLLLSDNQGGFPRSGFYLDRQPMRETAYVDLHRNGDLTDRFGAMNQIYPHELMHLIVGDLAGPHPEGGDNQVHAIGVRTDRVTAFSEGFAEHAQLMAVEAEGVAPETRRLPSDPEVLSRALDRFAAYRAAVSARWSIAPKARMTFVVWFSPAEQVLRYHAVRQNLFAREAPPLSNPRADPYGAYLVENTMPGSVDGAPKRAARLLATEGVVSALFYGLATSRTLQRQYAAPAFYAAFGARRDTVDPLDNVYLKLFAAIKAGGYDTVAVVDAYQRLFPEDASAVSEVVRTTLLGQELPRGPAIWLRNDRVQTGTSLFDQYRGMPRAHTFDLNAASSFDLVSVPGVTPAIAEAILTNGPYHAIEELTRVSSAGPLIGEFAGMAKAYRDHVNAPDDERRLSLQTVLYPYLWRALYVMLACAAVSAVLYRAVKRARWYRVTVNGVAAACAGLMAGWSIDPGTGVLAFAAPIAFWGLPASLIALRRTRSPRAAVIVLSAWACASLVPALAVRPIG